MSKSSPKPIIYHIPVCPFSQRIEILLALKGLREAVDFRVVDITRPRDPALLAKTRGTTALPVLELEDGRIIKESLVILRYIEDRYPVPPVARADPYRRAVENMLIAMEGDFGNAGYRFVMNRDQDRRDSLAAAMDAQYERLDEFLRWQAADGDFLFQTSPSPNASSPRSSQGSGFSTIMRATRSRPNWRGSGAGVTPALPTRPRSR